MKNKTKKIIKGLIFYLIVMTIISIAGYFMSTKQLVELGVFLIAITDYRTDVMHDLLKIEGIQISKIHLITKGLRKDSDFALNEISKIGDKLSETENKPSEEPKTERFTLED